VVKHAYRQAAMVGGCVVSKGQKLFAGSEHTFCQMNRRKAHKIHKLLKAGRRAKAQLLQSAAS